MTAEAGAMWPQARERHGPHRAGGGKDGVATSVGAAGSRGPGSDLGPPDRETHVCCFKPLSVVATPGDEHALPIPPMVLSTS